MIESQESILESLIPEQVRLQNRIILIILIAMFCCVIGFCLYFIFSKVNV